MFRICIVLTVGLFVGFVSGCSDPVGAKIESLNATAPQRLANTYTFFQARNGYRGPKNEAELKEFCADPHNKKGFERAGIDLSNIDALFVSPRDNQPFRIRYGVAGSPMGFNEPLVFESVGVEGEVMVGFGDSKSKLMSPEEADELFSAKKPKRKKKLERGDSAEDAAKIEQ